ncbi:lytic murein transglycosylase B [Curvibacter sp. APW13]|uniref:lytic murein transglycosylase B n=1 Tax=Curvibacter sp. APW13 TaxID=3077236 RepID=UPI0028E06D91|nr:lytic murein transglycosylase B [Curvibacter sp. APW13]MDT8992035.1 lytic murein transglycosylase B [Curvibacter sp. APW13]
MNRTLRTVALVFIATCAIGAWAAPKKYPNKKPSASQKAQAVQQRVAKDRATLLAAMPLYAQRADALAAAQSIAQRRDLNQAWVAHIIGQARFMPSIAQAVLPPSGPGARNWNLYRERFVEPKRINAGVAFWQKHRETLERAQAQTGVPAEIIVGIIGIETLYGKNAGGYRVIDALCTLAFDFPVAHPRAAQRTTFFQSELEAFLALTARNNLDPLSLRGSYAGAMGMPQFMPSSWEKYGVDYDGDGKVDLYGSPADVIGSVANYFKAFQWQPGMPTHYPLELDPIRADLATLLLPDIKPSFSPFDMVAHGVRLDESAQRHPGALALLELQNGNDAPLYLAGTDNFYAITRYNWSSYYALAVIELGRAVAKAMPMPTAMQK